jgi:hypothetical protein
MNRGLNLLYPFQSLEYRRYVPRGGDPIKVNITHAKPQNHIRHMPEMVPAPEDIFRQEYLVDFEPPYDPDDEVIAISSLTPGKQKPYGLS